jgi:hypothetical protein
MAKARSGFSEKTILRRGRSRVANGSQLIPDVPNTSVWARRMRELMGNHIADLGGIDYVSSSERNLVRRAAALSVEAERLEKRFALSDAASPEEVDIYGRIVGHLRRVLEVLGLKRRPRTVGPSFGELMLQDLAAQTISHSVAVESPR